MSDPSSAVGLSAVVLSTKWLWRLVCLSVRSLLPSLARLRFRIRTEAVMIRAVCIHTYMCIYTHIYTCIHTYMHALRDQSHSSSVAPLLLPCCSSGPAFFSGPAKGAKRGPGGSTFLCPGPLSTALLSTFEYLQKSPCSAMARISNCELSMGFCP